MKQFKPFDVNAAMAGAAVCTTDGRSVRIVCYDARLDHGPILALIDTPELGESVLAYDCNGCPSTAYESEFLFMAPIKRTGWVNLYDYPETPRIQVSPIYDDKAAALDTVRQLEEGNKQFYVGTSPIDYEV